MRSTVGKVTSVLPFLLVLLLNINLINASPFRDPGICGPIVCPAENDGETQNQNPWRKFHYESGSVYTYEYNVTTTTTIDGQGSSSTSSSSGLNLNAKVTLRFISGCQALLFLSNVSDNSSPDPTSTTLSFINSLEKEALRFSFHDGLIEEICPEDEDDREESIWVLNFKRGVLSLLQNTMRRLDLDHENLMEDDVNGLCLSSYTMEGVKSTSLLLEKVRDLTKCEGRYGHVSSIQGVPYNLGKHHHKTFPLLKSLSVCEQRVDRKLVSLVKCEESHHLNSPLPLARGEKYVMKIHQNLELISIYNPPKNESKDDSKQKELGGFDDLEGEDEYGNEEEGIPEEEIVDTDASSNTPWLISSTPTEFVTLIINKDVKERVGRREGLRFQHGYGYGSIKGGVDKGRGALKDFCMSVKLEVEGTSADLWVNLITTLRSLSPEEMVKLSYEASSLCEGRLDPFYDALENVGTPGSIGLIRERILKGGEGVNPERIQSWINSLNFINQPDLPLLTEGVSILRARDSYPNILLSFSNLANLYCSSNPQCLKDYPISILVKLYEKYFDATGCATKKRKEMDQILMYLKGLGNFGVETEGISRALETCIKKNSYTEVRLTAIQALRRVPCTSPRLFPLLKSIFQDLNEDSELRIAAFLSIMKCPTYPLVQWIKDVLDREEVNQVGSFVSTYLTNLQTTSLPSKKELQGLLLDLEFSKKFSKGGWSTIPKFSRNFEFSGFHDDANFGKGVDGNLIFSQHSYIPRSASVNLTVDVWGESINLFEATLRLQNFEHTLESWITSRDSQSSKSSSTSSSNSSGMITPTTTGKRGRRDQTEGPPPPILPNRRRMRTFTLDYEGTKRYYQDPTMSLSLRTFGKEIMYKRWVGGEDAIKTLVAPFKQKLKDGLTPNWQNSRLLLDSSFIIPTGLGLPLNLSAQASSIIRLESERRMELVKGLVELKGKFIPSAMITMTGTMTLGNPYHGGGLFHGLKVKTSLRSSLAVDVGAKVQGTSLLDVEFGIPKKQLEVVDYHSELILLKTDGEETVVKVGQDETPGLATNSCNNSYYYLWNILGLRLCRTTSSSSGGVGPYYSFPPHHYTITLDKSNPTLLRTRFHYVWNNNQSNSEVGLTFSTFTGESRDLAKEQGRVGLTLNVDKAKGNLLGEILLPNGNGVKAEGKLSKSLSQGELEVSVNQRTLMVSTSFNKEVEEDGKTWTIKPRFDLKMKNQNLVKAQGEIQITDGPTFMGKGNGEILKGNKVHLVLDGNHHNESSATLSLNVVGNYGEETIKWFATVATHYSKEGHFSIDSTMMGEFSKVQENNFKATWKFQRNEEICEFDGSVVQGEGESGKVMIQLGGLSFRNHESSRKKGKVKLHFGESMEWEVEGEVGTQGKSWNVSVDLGYAKGKRLASAFSLLRTPGLFTFTELGWNLTLGDQQPFLVSLKFGEKAYRVYELQLLADWIRDRLLLDLGYSDRSKRKSGGLDVSCSLGIRTREAIDNLKFAFHILNDEKEKKVQVSSEYKKDSYSVEVGSSLMGRKQRIVGSLSIRESVYVVLSELDLENGLEWSIKTILGSNLPDIHLRVTSTAQNGVSILGLEYQYIPHQNNLGNQEGVREEGKVFLIEVKMDRRNPSLKEFSVLLTFPPHYHVEGNLKLKVEESVFGTLRWRKGKKGRENYLHLNGRLNPKKKNLLLDDALDLTIDISTPFNLIKNGTINVGLEILEKGGDRTVCQLRFDSSWRNDEHKMKGTMIGSLKKEGDDDDEQIDMIEKENEININSDNNNEEDGEKLNSPFTLPRKFRFDLDGNITSTVKRMGEIKVKVRHEFNGILETKTDFLVQFPNDKEISLISNWYLPRTLKDLLSTQAELRIKTPFVGFQNLDFQTILGPRGSGGDQLASFSIYLENFHYAVSVTGTPRFSYYDGALGIEVSTSNPKYDKIFGSFSYVIGDTTRLAFQLGWTPQLLISSEIGWEWNNWESFQVFYTFTTSSHNPLIKHVNFFVKFDKSQLLHIKLEGNENSLTTKCEWALVSWRNLDIRADGSTPWESWGKFGLILKHYWEPEETSYHSQVMGWINEQQVGYRFDGGTSEVEEEDVVAIVKSSNLLIDTISYPSIRGEFSLAERGEGRFGLTGMLGLREGPINVDLHLHLLDLYRFNENVTITTPYGSLSRVEINLSPAIIPSMGIYNLGIDTRWRGLNGWETGGLALRLGPQDGLSEVLTQEARDAAFLADDDDDDEGPEEEVEKIEVPKSQLFHFYAPIRLCKVLKVEMEEHTLEELLGEGESSVGLIRFLRLRKFETRYNSDKGNFVVDFVNEEMRCRLSGSLDVELSPEYHPSFKGEGVLDLSQAERKLNLLAASYYPSTREYSLDTTWSSDLPLFLQGKLEVRTPLDYWEEESVSLTYAHNQAEGTYSVDVDVEVGPNLKVATVLMLGPKTFSMTMNTPIQGLEVMEMEGNINQKEDEENAVNTIILMKFGNIREIQVDIDSKLSEDDGWPTQLSGSISTNNFPSEVYSQGEIEGTLKKMDNQVRVGDGKIKWPNDNTLVALMTLDLPNKGGGNGYKFNGLNLTVDTPFYPSGTWNLQVDQERPDLLRVLFSTPIPSFVSATIEAESSLLLKLLDVKLTSPHYQGAINSSWKLLGWNDLNFLCTLSQAGNFNWAKLRFKNHIPNLTSKDFTTLDSRILLETSNPFKLGAALMAEYKKGESFQVKMDSKHGFQGSTNLEVLTKLEGRNKGINFQGGWERLLLRGQEESRGGFNGKIQLNLGSPQGFDGMGSLQLEKGGEDSSRILTSLETRVNYSSEGESESKIGEIEIRYDSKGSEEVTGSDQDDEDDEVKERKAKDQFLHLNIFTRAKTIEDFSSLVNLTSSPDLWLGEVSPVSVHLKNVKKGSSHDGEFGYLWDQDRFYIDYFWDYETKGDFLTRFNLTLATEVPLSTESVGKPQNATISLGYNKDLSTKSYSSFVKGAYNGVQLLDSRYNTLQPSPDKRDLSFQLDNHFWPLGVNWNYSREQEGSEDEGESNPTTTTTKRLMDVYDLRNPSQNKLEGELEIKTNFTRSEITLTGKHPNRTIELRVDYDYDLQDLRHTTHFSWNKSEESSWVGYDIHFLKNEEDSIRGKGGSGLDHELRFRLSYPIRVITLRSGYNHNSPSSFKWMADVNFNASQKGNLTTILSWDGGEEDTKIKVEVRHPSLPKEGLRANAHLLRDPTSWLDLKVGMDYAPQEEEDLNGEVKGGVKVGRGLQGIQGFIVHEATKLNVTGGASLLVNSTHDLEGLMMMMMEIEMDFATRRRKSEQYRMEFELFKDQDEEGERNWGKARLMLQDPDGYLRLDGNVTISTEEKSIGIFGVANISGYSDVEGLPQLVWMMQNPRNQLPYTTFKAVKGKDGVYGEGGILNWRNIKFDVWEVHEDGTFRVSDVSCYMRLNHTRLFTAKVKWRPEIFHEVQGYLDKAKEGLRDTVVTKGGNFIGSMKLGVTDALEGLWEDAEEILDPFIKEMREDLDFKKDYEALNSFLKDTWEQNGFYCRDGFGYSQLILEEIAARVTEGVVSFNTLRENFVSELYLQVKGMYEKGLNVWVKFQQDPWGTISSVVSLKGIKEKSQIVAYYGIGFFLKIGEAIYKSLSAFGSSFISELSRALEKYRTQFLSQLHHIENSVYNVIVTVSDYLYQTKAEVMRSKFYEKLVQLSKDVDNLYREISQNDAVTNIKKIYGLVKSFIIQRLGELDYLVPFLRIWTKISELWSKLGDLECDWVQELRQTLRSHWTNIRWFLVDYLNVEENLEDFLTFLITKGPSILGRTALEIQDGHVEAKTKFIFDKTKGIISLDQKLPMPWPAFNETPNFQKLPEYQTLLNVKEWLQSSQGLSSSSSSITSQLSLSKWIPPFEGHAVIIGSTYIVTFDGVGYKLDVSNKDPPISCDYILIADLVDGNFTVTLNLGWKNRDHTILVTVGHNTLAFDVQNKGIRNMRTNQLVYTPFQSFNNLRAYQEGQNLVVESPKGITVSCNMVHWTCSFRVSGWYSRKVGGILGTMDHEPYTDLVLSSKGQRAKDPNDMVKSWNLNGDHACRDVVQGQTISIATTPPSNSSSCSKLFRYKGSSLQPCFSEVSIDPFYTSCLNNEGESESPEKVGACAFVQAYIQTCALKGILLKTPSTCVKCEINGEEVMDREMKVLSPSPVPHSTDVVLVIEGKECNRAFRTRRRIDLLVKQVDDILEGKGGFRHNRYAAVLFGGEGVFQSPHPLIQNGQVFTNASTIGKYLGGLSTGNNGGSSDIFGALWYTLHHLNFRPGSSKTFILFPCTSCHPKDMTVDYTDLYYAMLEQGATLHIFYDGNFSMDNKGVAKKILGIDRDTVYTKPEDPVNPKTINSNSNPANLRKQGTFPKSKLRYCWPLALQTNGSIFSTKKLQSKKESVAKATHQMFGERVLKSAKPSQCQTCYCSSTDFDGVGKVECYECGYVRHEFLPPDEKDEEDSNELENDDEEDEEGEDEDDEDESDETME